jgi:UDP-N-acetylglucosamine acyltransferase
VPNAALIHSTSLVDARAELDSTVSVGPFAIIGPHVKIDAGTVIESHASVIGHTTLGKHNRVFQHAVIGGPPQDKKYAGEPTRLEVGDHNTFRECVTLNTGTVQDEGVTRIGSHNWLMAYVHVGHDCRVHDHTIMANSVALGGHVQVGDYAILGGLTGVHQHVRVGAHAMTGAGSVLLQDLPPFVMSQGYPAAPRGLNSEGLKRRGFSSEAIALLKQAYKLLYRDGLTLEEARQAIEALHAQAMPQDLPHLQLFTHFLQQVTRGIIR